MKTTRIERNNVVLNFAYSGRVSEAGPLSPRPEYLVGETTSFPWELIPTLSL